MLSISVDEHAAHIRSLFSFSKIETAPLSDALGRCLATDVSSPVDLPLFRNSQMDGFAVRSDDTKNPPAHLLITGESVAGKGFDLLETFVVTPLRPTSMIER